LVDLIEQAFLEGQIDGLRADLACLWLTARMGSILPICYPYCYPMDKGLHQ